MTPVRAALVGLLLLTSACGADDSSPSEPRVTDAVIGAAAIGNNAALYGEIDGGPDRLVEVRSAAADRITVMSGGTDMTMEAADTGLPITVSDEAVAFVPGDDHLMLERLNQDLVAGDEIAVEFVFERAGTVTLDVPIVEPADLVERVPR